MDSKKLERANELEKEIKELDYFLWTAGRVWTGKLTIEDRIMKLISNGYGAIRSAEFNMNTTIKNRVLNVLEQYKQELEEEFKSL